MMKKRLKLCKGERILYKTAIICFFLMLTINVFGAVNVGSLSMTNEKLRFEIRTQEKRNESLVMKFNELTAFDKIKDVVKEMGLAYNNDNIIIISE
jgi:cell division protein FtsL